MTKFFSSTSNYLDLNFQGYGYSSVIGGPITLYGTCYAIQLKYYLNGKFEIEENIRNFILNCQDSKTGYFIGPELIDFDSGSIKHTYEHILLHLLCTVIPVLMEFNIKPRYEFLEAKKFLNEDYLTIWLKKRDWHDAWLEGNNLLFVGEILTYYKDIGNNEQADKCLRLWFKWLDSEADPTTGLWGTNGYCSNLVAMCGAYHQLLLYYYFNRPIPHAKEIIDIVLHLQHYDGGFSPSGGGGACEDADAVDILVNLYKTTDYKKHDIRCALRKCLNHIVTLQNKDGGFPYKKGIEQSHMGIPATLAGKNQSTIFATWFRLHTIALIAEILPSEKPINNIELHFNSFISMGWHRKWDRGLNKIKKSDKISELLVCVRRIISIHFNEALKLIKRVLKGLFRSLNYYET